MMNELLLSQAIRETELVHSKLIKLGQHIHNGKIVDQGLAEQSVRRSVSKLRALIENNKQGEAA